MVLWTQIVLVVILLVVCIFLCVLLRQLRYTAIAIQQLAESAKADFRQVATDIHDFKNHTDKLLSATIKNAELPLGASDIISKVIHIADPFIKNKSITWLEILFTNLKFIKRLMRKS